MGWVIFFVILGLLCYAGDNPATGVPLIIFIVGGFIAVVWWSVYSNSDKYKEKKRQEALNNKRMENQHKMDSRSVSVNNMANGELFKQLRNYIWDLNRRMYERVSERECSYNFMPPARHDMVAYPTIKIEKTRVWDGRTSESIISFDEWGYKDLTDDEIELLGMALIRYGKYKLYDENNSNFSHLSVDWEYWKPYVDRQINIVHARRKSEYEKTHRSIY